MMRFLHDESGVATTEYLMLIGVLVGGVLLAVTLLALRMSQAYDSWGAFFVDLKSSL